MYTYILSHNGLEYSIVFIQLNVLSGFLWYKIL